MAKKKTYKVKVSFTAWDVIEVEAESEAEARELAEEKANDISLYEMNLELDQCTILN